MKFILMMHTPYGSGDYDIMSKWTPEAFQAHVGFMQNLNAELRTRGELAQAEGLAPPNDTRIVRAGARGEPEVSDGPFAESKEFLAGFWIVEVKDRARAHAIAAAASMAPGPTGEPLHLAIEVREVFSIAPAAK